MIVINQCGSYAENFANQIKPLSAHMSEIIVRCGICSSISLKGLVNVNVEFCSEASKPLYMYIVMQHTNACMCLTILNLYSCVL